MRLALWIGLAAVLLIAAAADLRWRWIPNVVTYPAFVLALLARAFFEGLGDLESGLLSGLAMGLLALAGFGLLAWRRKVEWGDAKLMAVVGAALGFPLALSAALFISLCGALQAVVLLLLPRLSSRAGPAPRSMPYAIPIALGSFWAMWWQHSTMLQ